MRKSRLSWHKLYVLAMDFVAQRSYLENKEAKNQFQKDKVWQKAEDTTNILMEFLEFAKREHK